MDRERKECRCEDCGKRFLKGDEGDNERFCLRCEYAARIERMDPDEKDQWLAFGDMDREEDL